MHSQNRVPCNEILSLVLDGLTQSPLQFTFIEDPTIRPTTNLPSGLGVRRTRHTSVVLGLLGSYFLLQSFEANHRYWKQP